MIRLSADPWRPDWLPTFGETSPEAAAFASQHRRSHHPVTGDPFLESVGRMDYSSDGQRRAIRAVLSAPPRSTLVVNLPTGVGKSLCALALTKIRYPDTFSLGTTVVVVPTTALSVDQERAARHLVPHSTAYIGARTDADRRRNQEICNRLRNGSQGIVFTSPEAITGSLRTSLYAAAESDLITALVVDEAHIVDQWGDEFRTSFQKVAGLRRGLLRAFPGAQFRTLLLSATLTVGALRTLDTLFGEPGPCCMISAVQLRTEPSYWISRCTSAEEQSARIFEAMRFLPRPLILYSTLVADAHRWHRELKNLGHRRIGCVTGKTAARERNLVVEDWAKGHLDIVVATSAFGLGIDQANVRAVVHACVPETIDRYYQEVGRGGRDGNASVSLMVYTDADRRQGRELSQRKIITVERGLQRWRRMFDHAHPLDRQHYRVPVDIAPGIDERNIDMVGMRNSAWNARTLTLMARARLIALDDEVPPLGPGPAEFHGVVKSPDDVQVGRTQVVEILAPEHYSEETWLRKVEPVRQQTEEARRLQQELLSEMLSHREEVLE